MGPAGAADQLASKKEVSSSLPEETHYLVHDALNCFSLVQVLNGAIASLVTLAGYLYKQGNFAAGHHGMPWNLLRFAFLCLVGLVSHKHSRQAAVTQALSTKREFPWGVRRHALVHAAIYMQLAWFSSELVLASTAVALAPRIMGQPMEETQFSYVPASAALQVYGCGVLITVGAALCFSSRQRRHLQNTRADSNSSQFISENSKLVSLQCADASGHPGVLVQPLLPEVAV